MRFILRIVVIVVLILLVRRILLSAARSQNTVEVIPPRNRPRRGRAGTIVDEGKTVVDEEDD